MEKKEARIKCSGCGASYKIRIPVTDQPVSFKCKKCGKVLKLKVKASTAPSPAPVPEMDFRPPTNFETTQLPDEDGYQDASGPMPSKSAGFVEQHTFEQGPAAAPEEDKERRWVVLARDKINGPFTVSEVVSMIQTGEVTPQSSLRMGERPWVKAGEIADFKRFFFEPLKGAGGTALDTISLLDKEEEEKEVVEGAPATGPFYKQFSTSISYPISGGKPLPLAIFAGIVFVGSVLLSFEPAIGFPLSILLWLLLYGYLSDVMDRSKANPQNPPPDWDFSKIKTMLVNGVNIFVVFLVYTLVPLMLALLGAVYFFLNQDATFGGAFAGLGLVLYIGSLFTVPACLAIVSGTRSIGAALNPGRVLRVIRKGGKAYLMLAVFSLVVGLICMTVSCLGVMFLADAIPVGFVVSGLLMAGILSYAHFVWFHVLGRFSAENRKLLTAK